MNPTLIKNYLAGAAIAAFRIVKFSADNTVIQGAAATDYLIGIADGMGASASGARVDVVKGGVAYVEFGGSVTRGGPVTADANGKAVAAAPSAGTQARIIGFAEVTAASGDIAPVLIAPVIITQPAA
jgi:hypothetical protein